jgi:acetolactate synthase-1/2/3 large subunit
MARENLDVLVVVFANHAYQILQGEYASVGAGKLGQRAKDMLTLDRPFLDWQALARGHGIASARANDLGEFASGLRKAFSERGPFLLEVNLAA